MANNFLTILEETTSKGGILSSGSNRMLIILTVGLVLLAGIAIWLLVKNQKLEKQLKEAEEGDNQK